MFVFILDRDLNNCKHSQIFENRMGCSHFPFSYTVVSTKTSLKTKSKNSLLVFVFALNKKIQTSIINSD